MSILQVPMQMANTVGVSPNFKFMVCTDNLATVTAAGYLNAGNLEGNPLQTTDILNVLYNFNQQTQVGTFEQFAVTLNNGVITLTAISNAGEVTLPTIANHIATYTNTSGHLSEDPATAISGGNIQAGLSGTAGYLASYPSTASKGSLIIQAVANTGNTNTTLSNNAMGQASVVNIPDPANAIGQLLVGATATPFVNGNFPQNSGTVGLMVDSGIATSNLMKINTSNAMTSAGSITFNKVNGTEAANAVTASGVAGVITTSSLTTAGGSSYAITWTNTSITSTSVILLTILGGTNTTENITLKATSGSGTSTLTIYNNTAGTALNGTILINYLVM